MPVFFPYPWSVAGIYFENVQKGRIENSLVVGVLALAIIDLTFPSFRGVGIDNSKYISIDTLKVSVFMLGDKTNLYPWYYSLILSYDSYISVTNSNINGHYALWTTSCDHFSPPRPFNNPDIKFTKNN